MVCRGCGATIADKAIVCYRCGTSTAVPAGPVAKAPRRTPWLLVVLLLVVAVGLGWLSAGSPAASLRQIALAIVAVVTGAGAVFVLVRRR